MPSNNSPVRTCCSRTTAFSSENRPCPHHSDPPTLSFRPAHTVIPTAGRNLKSMPSNNSPVRTCCSRTTAFSSENRPCPHHSDPPTLSFRPAHTVIPTAGRNALKQLASPYLLFTDHRLFHLQRCRQRPAWTIAMKIEARSTNPSFPRRACPRAPTRGRESRARGRGHPFSSPYVAFARP